ncbi:MAG: flagellar biosynthetic protein FliO [SAR324 cluster bacterium]|nr:flagellar biosynthetic protein FliO [SAR324 cluster bacterium]
MRCILRTLFPIGLAGLLALAGGPVWAQSFSRTLDSIRFFAAEGKETILLEFSSPYEGNPIEEHQRGEFRLRFSATGSKLSRSLFQIKERSVIQDYRVVQNEYAATLVVNLRDPRLNLEGRLSFERDGNAVRVTLIPPAAAAAATVDQQVLAQAEQRIGGAQPETEGRGGQPALGNPDRPLGAMEGDWMGSLVTMVLALVFVLLVLYGLVFVYNRFLAGRIRRGSGGYPIRHLGSFAIGPKQRIVVLDIDGEVVACGVTPHQISFLTRLGGAQQAHGKPARSASPSASQPAGGSAPDVAGTAEGSAPKDPVHQFAETLREKVRSLKRIK